MSKMLASGTSILGVKHCTCGDGHCPHVKYRCNTCHCRACPSCGSSRRRIYIRRPLTPPYIRFRIRRFLPTDKQRQRVWFR
ncbi:transposase zinc-binding domain-containing protein [Pseudomonas sp. FP603]|uniref:transposase zinc-binding domain-containing protein n=1 Tax=Pseudomonas sp. FP603 TaxID=2954097 RepID=UPI00351DCF2E